MENCHTLTKLFLINYNALRISELPSWIRGASSLQDLSISGSEIASLPDWIGDLRSLTAFSLYGNEKIKILPDSIGNLNKLTRLDLRYSPIEKLPDSIMNCTVLESVDINGTNIKSVPDFIKSIKFFDDNTLTEIIPQSRSISYRCFCNSYYNYDFARN